MSLRYDIEFYSVSPYNVLTGTDMPSNLKGDKNLILLPYMDGFYRSGEKYPKLLLSLAVIAIPKEL